LIVLGLWNNPFLKVLDGWGSGGISNFPYWLALECWIKDFIVLGRIISLAKASGFQECVFPIPLFSWFNDS
jgi:hypothetical protein